jgi:hypothetical protein
VTARKLWLGLFCLSTACSNASNSQDANATRNEVEKPAIEFGNGTEEDNSIAEQAAADAMLAKRARNANENAKSAKILNPKGYSACNDLLGFSIENDPKGLNVRDKPNGVVIGTVPPVVQSGGLSGTAGPLFTIIGSQDGWFQVKSIGVDEQIAERKVDSGYMGEGWVSAKKIGFNIQSTIGFDKPHDVTEPLRFEPDNDLVKTKSRIVADLMGEGRLGEVKFRTSAACQKGWVLTEFSFSPREKPKESRIRRAWFRGICDNIETSCDGLASDY